MCDTLGKIGPQGTFFAKNSDRSPNEVQLLEYHPRQNQALEQVACTYITIPQVRETYGVLLSRPAWMWGAEMGVNEFGLCIGNEAVFTKGTYGKNGLTGMDMVRLALERCRNAQDALELLISLLETYGQGGNCGFDHKFYYDNAFLIMDRKEIFVLETAGKKWVYKRCTEASISNRLTIGRDGTAYSQGTPYDFRKKHTEPVYTTFSGSSKRISQTAGCLPKADTLFGCLTALRSHSACVRYPFAKGSVLSACMHYGGAVGDHTTASMAVSLEEDRILVWATGCSVPCASFFKPWLFGTEPVLPVTYPSDNRGEAYWMDAERFRRNLLGKNLPWDYYAQRNALEHEWEAAAKTVSREDFPSFSRRCLQEEKDFYDVWKLYAYDKVNQAPGFRKRWDQKNRVLFAEDPICPR